MIVYRSEVMDGKWINTSYLRTDEKEEFRERKEYGNRHAVFEKGSEWGEVHYDEYNATDFPIGTINHAAKYTEEKTSIPKGLVAAGIVLGGLFVGYKLIKFLGEESS